MKVIEPGLLKEAKNIIPKGPYCYSYIDTGFKYLKRGIRTCPFWDQAEDHDRMESGYCHFLKRGDWEDDGFTMLWDMVKECGINMEDENES